MRYVKRLTGAMMMAVLALAAAGATTQPSVYVQPGDVDWQSLLAGPPAAGSAKNRAELAMLMHLQYRRTAEDVSRCRSEAHLTTDAFCTVLGDDFNIEHTPQLVMLLDQLQIDTNRINGYPKRHYKRIRPFLQDPAIHPCIPEPLGYCYPSGDAAVARVWGRILANLFPEKRKALLERANQIGHDRAVAGVHFPSDVAAAQKLGDAIANKLLDDDTFKAILEQVRQQCPLVDKSPRRGTPPGEVTGG